VKRFQLARTPFFEGLDAIELAYVYGRFHRRRFAPGEFLCRQGEPGDRLWVIERGLVDVNVDGPNGPASLARLRRGDVVGEMALVTGQPRSAHVVATVPTSALELGRDDFMAILTRYPALIGNLLQTVSERLTRANLRPIDRRGWGEPVALLTSQPGSALVQRISAATIGASVGAVHVLDVSEALPSADVHARAPTAERVLEALDDLLLAHTTVLVVLGTGQEEMPLLLEHMERIVVVASEYVTSTLAGFLAPMAKAVEVVLLSGAAREAPAAVEGLRVVRTIDPDAPDEGAAWLGRHLARTEIGLALGAGGASAFAHVGALHALEGAGYAPDFLAGSSTGAIVAAWRAMGKRAADVGATMRGAFRAEALEQIFPAAPSAQPANLEALTRLLRESTEDRSFADLEIPLTVMAVDLDSRLPVPIREGPVWEALLASTALAGVFPPFPRGLQRLVDGLHLVPVPTEALRADGADLVVAVNLMSRERLPAWPEGAASPDVPRAQRLDTLLRTIDLAHLDSSIRHAGLADVVITPRFGPCEWQDFHLADAFIAAGRQAAEEQVPALGRLARARES
jgi:predicted acylesterase/phospholipase RssA